MASGDVALTATAISVSGDPFGGGGSGNVLSFGQASSSDPTVDDGGFTAWLAGNMPNSNYQLHLMVRVSLVGDHTSIGHPPFNTAKMYDITIKEH